MNKNLAFGGDWTEDKLNRLSSYLSAYMQALKHQPFKKLYVDAFASTGYRMVNPKVSSQAQLLLEIDEPEFQGFFKGSAYKALEVEPRFSEYLFIEKDPKRSKELENLKILHPLQASSIQIVTDDANAYLKHWCKTTDWRQNRAVLFLDPWGMEVEWSLLEDIAKTKAIDVWLLFPFIGVNRHLTRGEPPPESWAARITKIMGEEKWRDEFYPKKIVQTLFGEEETQSKDTDFERISAYFVKRLGVIFPGVAQNPLPLRNSRNVPLFLLCFAVANENGKGPALRMANHILKRR